MLGDYGGNYVNLMKGITLDFLINLEFIYLFDFFFFLETIN
jgi:hypothetical protein